MAPYAERGQLGWLDWTQPGLPLRLGKGIQLPALYAHPTGKPYSYFIQDGRFYTRQ
ncbi:MAG: hypothetical protein WCF84_19595 [Anaerolineae bacterium]